MAIVINTIEELQLIGNDAGYPLDGDYELGNDIDASVTSTWNGGSGFDPIGSSAAPFTGTFDGKDFTISSLYINRPLEDNVGLFGVTSYSVSFSNMILTNVSVTGRYNTGALIGNLIVHPSYINNISLNNCSASGELFCTGYGGFIGYLHTGSEAVTPGASTVIFENCISSINISGGEALGGLIGELNVSSVNFTVSGCSMSGSIQSTGDWAVGGLIGDAYIGSSVNESLIYDTFCTGDITGVAASSFAGFIGYLDVENDLVISNCYSTGNINVFGDYSIAGFIGSSEANDCIMYISNCYSTGNVIVEGESIYGCSGFIGEFYPDRVEITNCYCTGDLTIVDSDNSNYHGGFISSLYPDKDALIRDCFYIGNIDISSPSSYISVGGFIGASRGDNTNKIVVNIENCYSKGAINCSSDSFGESGGFVGRFYGEGMFITSNCYSEMNISFSGNSSYAGVGGFIGSTWAGRDLSLGEYCLIKDCYYSGSVEGYSSVGGFIGSNNSYRIKILRCYSEGEVAGYTNVGGFIGEEKGINVIVSNCFSKCSVESESVAGGFIGLVNKFTGAFPLIPEVDTNIIVTNVYSTGSVTGSFGVGGLVGVIVYTGGSVIIEGSYWDTETSGLLVSAAGTGKTTSEMKQKSTFTGWGFY